MKYFIKIICVLLLTSNLANAQNVCDVKFLEERVHSETWQIRYSVINEITERNDECKALLVKLIKDEHDSISNQALVKYLGNYVKVDKELVLENIEKLNPIPLGSSWGAEPPDVRSADMYRDMLVLDDVNHASNARRIMFIGIVGTSEDIKLIKNFKKSENDYVLLETAKAMIRLDGVNEGLEIINEILNKDVEEHLYYQTEALYVLAEINKNKYHSEYAKVKAKVDSVLNIEPNWMNGFFIQGLEADFQINSEVIE